MLLARDLDVIGQVVVVGVGVVDEPALLDEQLAGVDRRARTGSTSRAAARRRSARSTRPPRRCAPSPPRGTAASAPPSASRGSTARGRPLAPTRRPRGALPRHRRAVERDRDLERVEQSLHAPHAGPAAVLVDGLDREVAVLGIHRVRDLTQRRLAAPVTLHDLGDLRALLPIQHDAERHARTVGPGDLGHLAPVADHVSLGTRTGQLSELRCAHLRSLVFG